MGEDYGGQWGWEDTMIDRFTYGDDIVSQQLVVLFNRINDRKLIEKFGALWYAYLRGLEDLTHMRRAGTRTVVLEMWHNRYYDIFTNKFSEGFERNNISITLVHNMLKLRWRNTLRNAEIIDRLNQNCE